VSLEELPVKILIGRTIKNIDKTQQRLIKSFGNRTAILVIKEKSISSENETRLGHAIIEINSVQNIKIHDLNSTNGTYAATCGQLSNAGIRKTDKTIGTDRMLSRSDSNIRRIYEVENLSDFIEVENENEFQAPLILKTGHNYIYVGYV
jgi:hypothetical protein